jgi:hypothetical protein
MTQEVVADPGLRGKLHEPASDGYFTRSRCRVVAAKDWGSSCSGGASATAPDGYASAVHPNHQPHH